MSNAKGRSVHDSTRSGSTNWLVPAIDDREAYDQGLAALPTEVRPLATALTVLADLCRYFDENHMDIPPHLVRAVSEVATLPLPERAERVAQINLELMEYLNSVSEDSGPRM